MDVNLSNINILTNRLKIIIKDKTAGKKRSSKRSNTRRFRTKEKAKGKNSHNTLHILAFERFLSIPEKYKLYDFIVVDS